jgi:hypothetical protein
LIESHEDETMSFDKAKLGNHPVVVWTVLGAVYLRWPGGRVVVLEIARSSWGECPEQTGLS